MKPFVEISFMPSALARGRKTVFYYTASGSPPKSYLSHLGPSHHLSRGQISALQRLTRDTPEVRLTVHVGAAGRFARRIPMRTNDIVLVKLSRQPE